MICALFRWKDVETDSAEQVPRLASECETEPTGLPEISTRMTVPSQAAKPLLQNPTD